MDTKTDHAAVDMFQMIKRSVKTVCNFTATVEYFDVFLSQINDTICGHVTSQRRD